MKNQIQWNCINQTPRIIDELQEIPNTQNEPVFISQGAVGQAVTFTSPQQKYRPTSSLSNINFFNFISAIVACLS